LRFILPPGRNCFFIDRTDASIFPIPSAEEVHHLLLKTSESAAVLKKRGRKNGTKQEEDMQGH
jgi:hypothetical protein